MAIPQQPKVYHITHIDNLPGIIDAVIWSNAERIARGVNCTEVGMSEIKRRRLDEIEVICHPGTTVGAYVPFYFCPRSVMLYILYKGNNPGLTYTGGQHPIVHLQADLNSVIKWADLNQRNWAISNGNAGAYITSYTKTYDAPEALDWDAIATDDWRDPIVKDRKQAEFLLFRAFPWSLFERVGVIDNQTAAQVLQLLGNAQHRPEVVVRRDWYY